MDWALDNAAADGSVRVVVLTGDGRGFSAGADLMAKLPSDAQGRPDLGYVLENYYNPHLEDASIAKAGHRGG